VITKEGHLFSKAAILEYYLDSKKAKQKAMAEWEAQQQRGAQQVRACAWITIVMIVFALQTALCGAGRVAQFDLGCMMSTPSGRQSLADQATHKLQLAAPLDQWLIADGASDCSN
jgi:hypothetical protein